MAYPQEIEQGPVDPQELAQLGETAPELADYLMDQEGYGYAPALPTALDPNGRFPANDPYGRGGKTPAEVDREFAMGRFENMYQTALQRQQELASLKMAERANLEQGLEATAPQRAGITQAAQQMGGIADRIAQTQAPTLPEPPRMQNFLNRDVASMMLSIGTMIGGINSNGSIRSIRANKALAGSINGFMEGNMTMAQLGLQDWKNQMTKQVSEFEMIRQNNRDILEASGKSLEAKKFELEMAMAPFGMKQKIFENDRTFIADAVKLDKELFEINKAMMGTMSKVDPVIADLNLQIKKTQLEEAKVKLQQMQAKGLQDPNADKPGPAGHYYDKTQERFIPNIPTRGELSAEPNRFARLAQGDKQAVEFLQNAKDQLPQIRGLAEKILPTTSLGAAGSYVSGLTSRYRPGETAAMQQEFKQRAGALKIEATRLEAGSSRVLASILQNVSEQIPDITTNKDTALNQLKSLEQLIDIRLRGFLGGGVPTPGGRPGEQTAPMPGLPSGGQIMRGQIVVKRKSDGRTGLLLEKDFNPQIYEKVPEGVPVQGVR